MFVREPGKVIGTPSAGICLTISILCCQQPVEAQQNSTKEEMEEVRVTASESRLKFEPTLQAQKLLKTAGTIGDPMQAIFSLPGVVQVDEEDPDPAVRGSSPNANLFLVDGLPVGFLFHGFGNSIFNEELIHDFGFKPAGFGARYGQATGAVFDVSLRNPRNKSLATTVDLSLFRAGILLEGGITKNQSAYFSYRGSLIQFFLSKDDEEEDIQFSALPTSTDYQGKYLWQLENGDNLVFEASGAQDKAAAKFGAKNEDVLIDPGLEGKVAIDELFHRQSINWNRQDGYLSLGHIGGKAYQKVGNGEFLDLKNDQWILKGEQRWHLGNHLFTGGGQLERETYDYNLKLRLERCSDFTPNCEFSRRNVISKKDTQKLNSYQAFVEDQWQLSENILLTSGLHLTRDDYLKQTHADPRFHLAWQFSDNWTLNSSVGKYHQRPEEGEIFPEIGNQHLKSISSTHYVLGLNHQFSDKGWFDSSWSINAETYYKDIDQLVVDTNNDAVPYLNQGEGKAYGLELMLNKERTDRWYGWMSLSYAKTERTNKITGLNTPFSYDVPLVVNMVVNYQLTDNWNMGMRWTYRSGSLYSPIVGNRENPQFPGSYIPVYGELNSKRVEAFHRLDLRFERPFDSYLDGVFYIDIVNLYNRKNISGVEYQAVAAATRTNASDYKLEQVEGYGLIPSIGVKLKF